MGTHLRVLSQSYLMSTNMRGFGCFSNIFAFLVLWMKVASALEGSIILYFLDFFSKVLECICRIVCIWARATVPNPKFYHPSKSWLWAEADLQHVAAKCSRWMALWRGDYLNTWAAVQVKQPHWAPVYRWDPGSRWVNYRWVGAVHCGYYSILIQQAPT